MSSTEKAIVVAAGFGGCVAFMLGLAWLDGRASQKAVGTLADLETRQAALRFEVQVARRRLAEATRDAAALQAAESALMRAAPIPFRKGTAPKLDEMSRIALVAADPRLRALGLRAFRAGMAQNLGPFFRALNLDADQVGRFTALECRHWEAQVDVFATAGDQGVPTNDPSVTAMLAAEGAQHQAAERSLLGDAGYQQLQNFYRAQPLMDVVNAIAGDVAFSPVPLTGTQEDELLQLLANASGQYQAGGAASTGTLDWPAIMDRARPLLLPSQFSALEVARDKSQVYQLASQFYSSRAPAVAAAATPPGMP
jgi:hypothetical protein